jgi:DNA-binding PadR family transcriptional regulator
VNKKPKTWYQITTEGRHALERLFRQLEGMLTQAKPTEGLDDGVSPPNATSS